MLLAELLNPRCLMQSDLTLAGLGPRRPEPSLAPDPCGRAHLTDVTLAGLALAGLMPSLADPSRIRPSLVLALAGLSPRWLSTLAGRVRLGPGGAEGWGV